MPKFINLQVTKAQYEKLMDVLSDCQDEGPCGAGWRSEELISIIENLESQGKQLHDD